VRETQANDRVFFGAWVVLEKDDGDMIEYRIVGPDEADAPHNCISMDSPLAKALLKKSVDDEVRLQEQNSRYIITAIRYS